MDQADPAVVAPMDDDVLTGPDVHEQVELLVEVEHLGDGLHRPLGLRGVGPAPHDLALLGGLQAGLGAVGAVGLEVRDRLADLVRLVAPRHVGAHHPAQLASQPFDGGIGCLARVRPGHVGGQDTALEHDMGVGDVAVLGPARPRAQRQPRLR